MNRRFSSWHLGLLLGGIALAAAAGCSDDAPADNPGGSAGEAGAPAGGQGSGEAGDTGSGEAGDTGSGGAAAGGAAAVAADIDDVVTAVCDWEFRCCDEGERRYRLSPFAESAADCAERFIFEMRESNSTTNPYASGNAVGILGALAYTVDLSRVEVDMASAGACVARWEALDCNSEVDPGARCAGPPEADPCSLTALFRPKLALDEPCTLALTEGVYGNDVECLPGSTCLEEGHPDNPNDFHACVKRGVEGEPCTADDDCDYDFYCNDSGDCAAKAGADEECSFEDQENPAAGEEVIQCKSGLSCHPVDFTCVEPCKLDAACTDDVQCPAGSSCAPLTVENDTTSFKLCRELGDSATARCDSDADCEETHYCDGSVCQEDVGQNDPCDKTAMCPEGMHCEALCVSDLMPGDACGGPVEDQCGPPPARCIEGQCSAGPVDEGEPCAVDADCKSGLCERAAPIDIGLSCIAGAGDGDDCDVDTATGGALRCGPGLYCNADAQCAPQSGPGGDCENPDTMTPDATLCSNASCLEQWEEVLCSDTAVPKTSGGTNVTCDGE